MDPIFVLVFVSASCPPCERFKDTYTPEMEGVRVVIVDIEDKRELAKELNVSATPTFVVMKDEEPQEKLIGYPGDKKFREWLRRIRARHKIE